jgi:hypothetical protein
MEISNPMNLVLSLENLKKLIELSYTEVNEIEVFWMDKIQ